MLSSVVNIDINLFRCGMRGMRHVYEKSFKIPSLVWMRGIFEERKAIWAHVQVVFLLSLSLATRYSKRVDQIRLASSSKPRLLHEILPLPCRHLLRYIAPFYTPTKL